MLRQKSDDDRKGLLDEDEESEDVETDPVAELEGLVVEEGMII